MENVVGIEKRSDGRGEIFASKSSGGLVYNTLGVETDGAVTWREAIEKAGLDWTVSKHQLRDPWGNQLPTYGIFRDDNKRFLGSVGAQYTPVQNQQTFEFLDAVMQSEDGAHYETAGALYGGKKIWALASIPDSIKIGKEGDSLLPYLLGCNSNDGSSNLVFKLTSVRPVCSNTLNVALKQADVNSAAIRIRHTKKAIAKMEEALKFLASVRVDIENLGKNMNILADAMLSKEAMGDFLTTMFPKIQENESQQAKATDILTLFELNDGDVFKQQRGTAFNMLNAVTNYVDHKKAVRPRDEETEASARSRGALFGAGEAFKFAAYQQLIKLVSKHNLVSL